MSSFVHIILSTFLALFVLRCLFVCLSIEQRAPALSSLSAISDPCVGALSYRHRHPPPTNNSSKIKDGYDEISKLIFFISSYRHPPPTNDSTTCCAQVSGFQKFKDRYDEISKFIFCSSSPIATHKWLLSWCCWCAFVKDEIWNILIDIFCIFSHKQLNLFSLFIWFQCHKIKHHIRSIHSR